MDLPDFINDLSLTPVDEIFGWCVRNGCRYGPAVLGNGYCVKCWDIACGKGGVPLLPKHSGGPGGKGP